MNTTTVGTTNDKETNCVNGCNRGTNDTDNFSSKSDCGCDETDVNVCECNRDPDCGCMDSKSIDSNSREGNDQDTNPNESDFGSYETDVNVCECNQDPDCECKDSKPKDSSSREQYEGDRGCETTSPSPPTCGKGEILDDCPIDCPSDYCPKSRYYDQSACSIPKNCPPPACKCRFNYRRAENGTCIPVESCRKFYF